jgi:hypothetical protein
LLSVPETGPETTTEDGISVATTNQQRMQQRIGRKKNKRMTQSKQQEQVGMLVASAIRDLADTRSNAKVDDVRMQCLLSEKAVRESEELRRGREELCQDEVQG